MNITIFGATGRTGQLLVREALVRGHEVVAHARSPERLGSPRERLAIVQGSILDVESISLALQGADAVISVLGPTENKPTFQVSSGTELILRAMREQGVDRLVISAGAGVQVEQDQPGLLHAFIQALVKVFSRWVYEDMVRTVATVRKSNINWTVVRVPMLIDGERTGNVRVGYVGKGVGARLSRADLANFMLDVAESDQYLHKAPVISS